MNMLVLEFTTLLLVLQRVSELVLARRNERRTRARGGIEYGAGHYPIIVLLHVCWFIAFNAESYMRGGGPTSLWPLWSSLFIAAQILRYWAISSLGEFWNTRIIVVPGIVAVRSGPYKYMPHPNYVAVLIEFVAVPMLVDAPITAIVGTVLNVALLLFVRMPAENRALAGLEPTKGKS